MTEKTIFIVKYHGGDFEDLYINEIFVTTNEMVAKKYVSKFNKILKKWKTYYKKYEENGWVKDEFIESKFERWYTLSQVTKSFYHPIELR